jgi:hypothetical protein
MKVASSHQCVALRPLRCGLRPSSRADRTPHPAASGPTVGLGSGVDSGASLRDSQANRYGWFQSQAPSRRTVCR